MKKILLIAALAAAAISASAQTIYVGGTTDDGIVTIKSSKGDVYKYAGKQLLNMGANKDGVYSLVQTEEVKASIYYQKPRVNMDGWADILGITFNDHVSNPRGVRDGWGQYVVFVNNRVYKRYDNLTDEKKAIISSIAMKVKGNDVVVAGTYAKRWGKEFGWYWSQPWGEVNGNRVYGNENSKDGWDRKSLKRKYFKGFEEPTRSLENIGFPVFDTDGTFTSVMHVKAVDYLGGKIYTTGWGEREYTYYHVNTAQDWYYVRRCARLWENGKDKVKQYENQTSAAYTLTVGGTASSPIFYSAGHHRGDPMGWTGNEDIYTKEMSGAVSSEAIVTQNNAVLRFFIVGDDLCVNDGKSIKVINANNWLDVVAYNNEVYGLYKASDGSSVSVVRIDKVQYNLNSTAFSSVPADGIKRDWHLAVY